MKKLFLCHKENLDPDPYPDPYIAKQAGSRSVYQIHIWIRNIEYLTLHAEYADP